MWRPVNEEAREVHPTSDFEVLLSIERHIDILDSHTREAMADLLSLPDELLCQILELSRPNGFESFMLSCKRVCYAGSNMALDHNFCKSLVIRTSNDGGTARAIKKTATSTSMSAHSQTSLFNPHSFLRNIILEIRAETRSTRRAT